MRSRSTISPILALALLVLLGSASAASATVYDITASDDLFGTLKTLQAGDEVVVHDGVYDTGGFLEVTWVGTANAPIVVRGADGERPHIRGVSNQNILNLGGSYFTFENFELTAGSHGIRLASAEYATLRNLSLHDLYDVGISCNRPGNLCDHLLVSGNEIYNTGTDGSGPGEGMYLGCNDAACTVSNSVFELNYIHDLSGGTQGDGIELKTGSFNNVLRDNVIVGANYPGITLYGFADGLGGPNVVERNLVWGSQDNGIQIVGQVIVRNNIIVNAAINGIHSKPSQGFEAHDAVLVHNTILGSGNAALKSNNWSGQANNVVANNALYSNGGTAIDFNGGAGSATVVGNIALGGHNAPGGVSAASGLGDFADAANLDFYPPIGSALINAGDATYAASDDFNLSLRGDGSPDAGAYEHSAATNPGWVVGSGFKDADPPPIEPVEELADTAENWTDTVADGTTGADATTSSDATSTTDTSANQDVTGSDDAATADSTGDDGTSTPSQSQDEGCGCTLRGPVSPAPSLVLWAFVALGAQWRRRR